MEKAGAGNSRSQKEASVLARKTKRLTQACDEGSGGSFHRRTMKSRLSDEGEAAKVGTEDLR